jgi:hypothetical protein
MRHIKLENDIPFDYSLEQLLADIPDAVIYQGSMMPSPTLLANYNVYPLVTTSPPFLTEDETAEEGVPEFTQGEWYQTWDIRKLTENEIQEIIDSRQSTVSLDNTNIDQSLLASDEMQTQRYEICNACPSFTTLKTCRECGCIMPFKIKLANASCPLEKW